MPVSGRTKHDVLTEFRTAEILSAARKVFAHKGMKAATVDEIAEVAGIAKGTVYLYFPSKRDLYLAALMNGVKELFDLTCHQVSLAQGAAGRIREFIGTRLRYVDQNRDFFKIYHSEFAALAHPATTNSDFCSLYRNQLDLVESILQQGIDGGELTSNLNPKVASSAIVEMTRGSMLRRILGWSSASLDEEIEGLCAMVWNGIAR